MILLNITKKEVGLFRGLCESEKETDTHQCWGWLRDEPIPTAGMTYRFVLSNPHVHVCLTAPANRTQLEENVTSLQQGPLSEEEMAF